MNAATTWETTLGQLQLQVTRANFDTWLRDTVGLRHEDDRFVVGAQNDFATEWLGTKLKPLIVKTLAVVLGHPLDVAFEVLRHEHQAPVLDGPLVHGADAPVSLRKRSAPPALSPRLTFDTFIVADENRLAADAARRAAAEPGALAINPLLVFGASGMGKTHLLQAIGHAAYERGLSVIYAPAERFGNDYVRARDGGFEQFRNRYRSADILLVDDLQFFEGKEKFQEEFFHTFNDLHALGKQICVAVDRRPSELTGIMPRLLSRLSWGLVADLERPAFETRLAILQAKAVNHALRLPEEALRAIAERCCPSVRELEGYLNRVLAYVPLLGGKASHDAVEKALSPLAAEEPATPPRADATIAAVSVRTGVTAAELRGQSRNRQVTYARHLAMFVLKEDAQRTVADIGRLLGDKDHSTVLAGIQRVRRELATREETRGDLTAVRDAMAEAARSAVTRTLG